MIVFVLGISTIWYHTLTISVVNAWLLYKRDCRKLGEKPIWLRVFLFSAATSLIYGSKAVRIGVDQSPCSTLPCKVRSVAEVLPAVSADGVGHLPEVLEKRDRCRIWKALSFISCVKCDVVLCLYKDKNCYVVFHK